MVAMTGSVSPPRLPLATRCFGQSLDYYSIIGSTNDEARRAAEGGAPHGHLVWAEAQSRGRGRVGRIWLSPPGANLYFTLLLRPTRPADQWPQLGFTAAVAMIDALRPLFPAPQPIPVAKWPNDIWVGRQKTAGILAEADTILGFVLLGIGLNVNLSADDFPPELAGVATSLRMVLGHSLDRSALLADLLARLENRYDEWESQGFEPIRRAWLEVWGMKGWKSRLEGEPAEFRLESLDADGALVAIDRAGNRRRIVAGDVSPVLQPEPAGPEA